MEPFEVMTSESQERMLAIVEPEDLDEVLRHLRALGGAGHGHRPGHRRRGLRCASSTAADGEVLADVPAASRCTRTPRCTTGPAPPRPTWTSAGWPTAPGLPGPDRLRRRPARHARRHHVGVVAVRPPALPQHRRGSRRRRRGAAAEAPDHGRRHRRGLALTTDGNHLWCAVDPRLGTALTVAESVMNLACVGARPLARRELPELRQPGAPRGHVAAVGGHRRHGRGAAWPSACRSSAAT